MIVAYDIADDRRRDRVALALQEHGTRVQYSVFVIDGRPASFVRLRASLARLIDAEVDSILLCDLGPRQAAVERSMSYLGARRTPDSGDTDPFIL